MNMKKMLWCIPLIILSAAFTKSGSKINVFLTKDWQTDTVFKCPESVLYNPEDRFIYVANINGKADAKDGNGFISRMTLDGKIDELEWVKGLDGPKGMGIHDGKLYVTDITRVVVISLDSAKIVQRIDVPGSVFLNDISVDAIGNIYITDSSDKKIYLLKKGVVKLWLGNSILEKPNGVLALEKGLMVIDMNTGIFYQASYSDKSLSAIAKNIAMGDGVMKAGPDEYIISCWPGEAYYVKGGQVQKILDTKEEKLNAADACYIQHEKVLLVPTFFGNSVVAYKLSE